MDFSNELVRLAKMAIDGGKDDATMCVRRLARKLRHSSPEASMALAALIKSHSGGLSRGGAIARLPVDLESRLELARHEYPARVPVEPIWTTENAAIFQQIIDEREHEEALAQADLIPTRSLLLVGPPGVGKTLSARWIAKRLDLALLTLDLSAVMSSLLGKTGSNLRNVLDYAKSAKCVLLLDEFDAIAKRRDDLVEVGELKRLVTVLLQEIENWPSTGILIAATNHEDLLDPAVWRRFDSVIRFETPDDAAVRHAIETYLQGQPTPLYDALAVAMKGMSYSDIERDLLRAKRNSLVRGVPFAECLESIIRSAINTKGRDDRQFVAMELQRLGYSQRKAHELTGVSRDTIRKRGATKNERASEDEEA